VVERRNRDHRTNRLALGKRHPILGRQGQAHWNLAPHHRAQFVDAQLDTIDCAIDFDLGINQWFAAFIRNLQRQMVFTRFHDRGSLAQDRDPLKRL